MVNKVFFVSDLHARPDSPEREAVFKEFLKRKLMSGDSLYILGDLFEFGFAFNGQILPYYQSLVSVLTSLQSSGVRIFFLPGNHDLWMCSYLARRGIRIIREGSVITVLGKKVALYHGLLKEPDSLSRLASSVMRNPDCVWLYSGLPQRLGFALAMRLSGFSRRRNKPFSKRLNSSMIRKTADEAEIIISGHHHERLVFKLNGKLIYITGDWITNCTYLEMTKNGLEQRIFSAKP